MLKLHPNCECCDKDLPYDSTEAHICSYECTFCSDCVENILHNVCPNCGGGFVPRPVRPRNEHRPATSIHHNPASTVRIHTAYSRDELSAFCNAIKDIPVNER